MNIEGGTAIVTGGASGLGEATARAISGIGAKVFIIDRDHTRGQLVADDIGGTFLCCDVSSESDIHAAVTLASKSGPIRLVVNCAGISRPARTVSRSGRPYDFDSFKNLIDVNLNGTFNVLRLAAASMSSCEPLVDGSRGVIINTASSAAFEGQVGQAAYSASKAAIVGMTLPIARDLAIHGIRIMTIAPGLFDTPIFTGADEMKSVLTKNQLFPLRAGRPSEFADLVITIVQNDFLNGEVIRLDGGARLPHP